MYLNKDIQTLKELALEFGINELQVEFSTAEQLELMILKDYFEKEYKKSISRRIKMGIAVKKRKEENKC